MKKQIKIQLIKDNINVYNNDIVKFTIALNNDVKEISAKNVYDIMNFENLDDNYPKIILEVYEEATSSEKNYTNDVKEILDSIIAKVNELLNKKND